jgi:hypothetical protein
MSLSLTCGTGRLGILLQLLRDLRWRRIYRGKTGSATGMGALAFEAVRQGYKCLRHSPLAPDRAYLDPTRLPANPTIIASRCGSSRTAIARPPGSGCVWARTLSRFAVHASELGVAGSESRRGPPRRVAVESARSTALPGVSFSYQLIVAV